MIAKKYLELIHGEVDGTNSQKQSAKLREYFAENHEARDLYDDLVSLSKTLSQVEEIDPSPNLKKAVLNSIRFDRFAAEKKKNIFRMPLLKPLFVRRNLQFASFFLAGLLLGVAFYSLIQSSTSSFENSNLYGTIIPSETADKFETGDYVEFGLESASGTAGLKYSPSTILTELDLVSREDIEIVVTFDSRDLSFSGFGEQQSVENHVTIGQDHVRFAHTGKNKYLLVFNNNAQTGTTVDLKILLAGNLIYETPLSTGQIGQ